jgi:ABC-type polysaccharide/polyol phosphate transport system ATPase subunit
MSNSNDVLIKVENVSKKFCRSLKRSMLYGIEDISRDLLHLPNHSDKLRKDEFWAVDDVSFEVKRGECLGIIGRNGAGKSTLLKMLNGIILPDKGQITIKGKVGSLIEVGAGFHPMLTGRENVYVNGSILGMTKREIDSKFDEIVAFAELEEFIDMPVKHYSSGMYVRLGFAIAAQMEPDVLILDEVLAVGDVSFQAKCMNTIANFRNRGTAFLLVSHNMHQISRHSDRVLYLKKGKSQYVGSSDKGLSLFSKSSSDLNENTSDWNSASGSGKIKFIRAYFLNKDKTIVEEVNANESLWLIIEFEKIFPIINPVFIDLIMRNHDIDLIQSKSQIFNDLPKKGCFEMSISQIPLNANNIQFFFTLLDANTKEIYDWKRNITLKIKSCSKQMGLLYIATDWKITSEFDY